MSTSRRKLLILGIVGATAIAIAATLTYVFVVKPETESIEDYAGAVAQVRAAHELMQEADTLHSESLEAAAAAAESAENLSRTTGPGFVDDTATLDGIAQAGADLIAVAGLVMSEAPNSATDQNAVVVNAPEKPALAGLGELAAPTDIAARAEAAQELRARIPSIEREASRLTDEAKVIETAIAPVKAAMNDVLKSAHIVGVRDTLPSFATDETVEQYTAAVDALAAATGGADGVDGTDGADPLTLMTAYQNAWRAGIASHEAVARTKDSVDEPTRIRGILIANKTYQLPSDFGSGITADTTAAFAQMRAAAAAEGHDIYIASGFRSYNIQTIVYNRFVSTIGADAADRRSARPGHSEHQTGLTFDLNSITEAFGRTPEGIWVAKNAHKYGFIVRYPQGKEAITGYVWEPWHMRYLGVDVATKVHASGLTLEEYLGITSAY